MNVYAIESTNQHQLCGINARNCRFYSSLAKAKKQLEAHARVNETDIAFDEMLDSTIKVYNPTQGSFQTADALFWITKCSVS